MSELTKEQLLEYVKKQKLKMKKLETEIATMKEKVPADGASGSDGDAIALRSEVKLLEQRIAAKDEEINALSKAVEDSEDEKIKIVAHKNAEIAALSDQIASFKTAASSASTLNAQVSELEATVADLEGKLERTQGASTAAEAARAELERRFESVREELEASRASASALEEQLVAAKKALQALQDREHGSGAEVEELRTKLTAAEDTERSLRVTLSSETANHASGLAKLEADLSCVREELESAGACNAGLRATAEELRAEVTDKAQQLAILAAENKDLHAQLVTASASSSAAAVVAITDPRNTTPPPGKPRCSRPFLRVFSNAAAAVDATNKPHHSTRATSHGRGQWQEEGEEQKGQGQGDQRGGCRGGGGSRCCGRDGKRGRWTGERRDRGAGSSACRGGGQGVRLD
jgi:chromosome segregation ATPase